MTRANPGFAKGFCKKKRGGGGVSSPGRACLVEVFKMGTGEAILHPKIFPNLQERQGLRENLIPTALSLHC